MLTFQGMRMRTEYMMEEIRRQAIDATMVKYREACRAYHTNGCDNGETVQLIHELEHLGVDPEIIWDIEDEIMADVYGWKE